MRPFPSLFAAAVLMSAAAPAHAASSFDGCTGFITTVPATISTPGTWCLDKDLSTKLPVGEAIIVAANNITIDCNGFKLGGLGAGAETEATAILSNGRNNTTVRGCNLRGFRTGVQLVGGGGHVVEDNRIEESRFRAVAATGSGGVVRRNLLLDNGTQPNATFTAALQLDGAFDILDNTIDGVAPGVPLDAAAIGIVVRSNPDGVVAGNRIRGLVPNGAGTAVGIAVETAGRTVVDRNHVIGGGVVGSTGITCVDPQATAIDNRVAGFGTDVVGCTISGNFFNPL